MISSLTWRHSVSPSPHSASLALALELRSSQLLMLLPEAPHLSAISLWGRSGRGHCRKFSANFREISANFPQNFRSLSWRNKTHFFAISANFPQNFRKLSAKTPSLTTPYLLSELLNLGRAWGDQPTPSSGFLRVPAVFCENLGKRLMGGQNVSVAPPAEPRGEKKTFFCANFGR